MRIAVALAVIFAAGLITGRYTAPRAPTSIAGANRRTITSEDILAQLTAELGLDAGQRTKVASVVEEATEEMAVLPPASPQRREVFRKCLPRIRALLRPDQYPVFERYVEMTERRWTRLLRRRGALQGPGSASEELPPPRR
jgi:hypothetical protein